MVPRATLRPLALLLILLVPGCVDPTPTRDPAATDSTLALRFRTPVDLGSQAYPVALGLNCADPIEDADGDCGLGEPVIEVDASGTVYLSGVCCPTGAPPLFVSRDQGRTFSRLASDRGVREAAGVEGALALDHDQTVYLADIGVAGSFQVTAWDRQGRFLHHTKWPAPSVVDRAWIRAHGPGELFLVYNTGQETLLQTSMDGGRSWVGPRRAAPFPLATFALDPKTADMALVGGYGAGWVSLSNDRGQRWAQENSTLPQGDALAVGAWDGAGTLHIVGQDESAKNVLVAQRDPDGTWRPPAHVSPPEGHHRLPWIAAANHGAVAAAWYGTLGPDVTGPWYLFVATAVAAQGPDWNVVLADPTPVLQGEIGRRLLDFLQISLGPDGAIHIGYAKITSDPKEERLHYVRTEPMTAFAQDVPGEKERHDSDREDPRPLPFPIPTA